MTNQKCLYCDGNGTTNNGRHWCYHCSGSGMAPAGMDEKWPIDNIRKAGKELHEYEESIKPITTGKSTANILYFIEEGKKGNSVAYATAEGNFLSPKAVEEEKRQAHQNAVKQALEACGEDKERWFPSDFECCCLPVGCIPDSHYNRAKAEVRERIKKLME